MGYSSRKTSQSRDPSPENRFYKVKISLAPRFYKVKISPGARCSSEVLKDMKEMFYLTTHSTHFIYGYMTSDIW